MYLVIAAKQTKTTGASSCRALSEQCMEHTEELSLQKTVGMISVSSGGGLPQEVAPPSV